MLPRERFGPTELLRWLEDTQDSNERAKRSHAKRRAAATLLRGESIELTWKSFNLNLNRWGPELEDLLNGRPQQFICEQDSWLELEGGTIPIGRIRTRIESARLADPGAVQRALESGLVPSLRLIPGDSDKAQRVLVTRPPQ